MEDSDHINDSCASTFCVINLILLMEHFCNCVDALRPDQHFFSHIGTFLSSKVEPLLSRRYSVFLKTRNSASDETRTSDPSLRV